MRTPEEQRAAYERWRAKRPEETKALRKKAIGKWQNTHREHVRTKTREQMRRWRSANRAKNNAKENERKKKWRAAHPEQAKERDRARYLREIQNANVKSRRLANSRAWYQKTRAVNPELFRVKDRRRSAREAGAKGSHTLEQWMARVEYHGWRCFYCNVELTMKTLTQDHRIALACGGSHWASNLVPACGRCNSSKAHRKLPSSTSPRSNLAR